MSVLDLIDVSQVFGDKANPTYALRNVSMSVEQRQVIIIMGPSGSGKSTMLAIAGALRRPTSGRVIVDGKELTGMNDSQLAD
ncbi:MAG TPA: ATP-binding cassette domain-containing protein, partial [Dehalococcoidia bacterium]